MSLHEYIVSRELSETDPPFYALIMAAVRQADTLNLERLEIAFPRVVAEVRARYNAPGGRLPEDDEAPSDKLAGVVCGGCGDPVGALGPHLHGKETLCYTCHTERLGELGR